MNPSFPSAEYQPPLLNFRLAILDNSGFPTFLVYFNDKLNDLSIGPIRPHASLLLDSWPNGLGDGNGTLRIKLRTILDRVAELKAV